LISISCPPEVPHLSVLLQLIPTLTFTHLLTLSLSHSHTHTALDIRQSWWRFLDSESCFTAVQKECATPPHVQVCHTTWLSFTRPSPRVSTASDKRWCEKVWVRG